MVFAGNFCGFPCQWTGGVERGRRGDYEAYTSNFATTAFARDAPLLPRSFPKPDNADEIWTRLHFPVKRYGYGWDFRTKTIKIATAVFVVHAAVILVHAAYFVFSGRSYTFAGDFADLLVLALRSRSTEALGATGVRAGNSGSWRKVTRVVVEDEEDEKEEVVRGKKDLRGGGGGLEIIVEDGDDDDDRRRNGGCSDDGDFVEMDDLRRRRRRRRRGESGG